MIAVYKYGERLTPFKGNIKHKYANGMPQICICFRKHVYDFPKKNTGNS